LVAAFGKRGGAELLHRSLLTRIPATLRPRSIRHVVEQLREHGVQILPVPLVEKEAFRDLFAHGGDLAALEERGVYGAPAALQNTRAYTGSIVELLQGASAGLRLGVDALG